MNNFSNFKPVSDPLAARRKVIEDAWDARLLRQTGFILNIEGGTMPGHTDAERAKPKPRKGKRKGVSTGTKKGKK